MVRAAATGAIDFALADPEDKWWWRKLRWTLNENLVQSQLAVLQSEHSYWLAIVNCYSQNHNLADRQQSLDSALDNVNKIHARIAELLQPWRPRPKIGMATANDAVAAWREEYGHPGDPRYDAMIAHNDRLLARIGETATRRRRREAREREAKDVPTTT